MKNLKTIFFSLILLFFFAANAQASLINPPIISDVSPGIKSFSEPLISGFTDKFTSVLVYIDGNFSSEAKTVSSLDRDSFYFFIDELPDTGKHKLFLISRDLNGVLSAPTKEFEFLIIDKLDPPRIIKSSFQESVYFLGESLNENYIEMYVNGLLFSTSFIERNSTNTFEFNEINISRGSHEIFFIARDKLGRKSDPSVTLNIHFDKNAFSDLPQNTEDVIQGVQSSNLATSKISEKAVSETLEDEIIVEGINNINVPEELNQEDREKEILDDILKDINNNSDIKDGLISENGESQSDLQWNLVIFLAFLVAVILWIIWVNREMKENDESENSSD